MSGPFAPSRKPLKGDPPLVDVQVWIRRPLSEPEGWHVEVRPEALTPEDIKTSIDNAFADLRTKVKELVG